MPGSTRSKDLRVKYARQNGRCIWCGVRCHFNEAGSKTRATRDHLISTRNFRLAAREGIDRRHEQAIVMACRYCNEKRGHKDWLLRPHPRILKLLHPRLQERILNVTKRD